MSKGIEGALGTILVFPGESVREMRQVGMVTQQDDADGPRNPLIAALNLATLALGIRLSEEVAMGPLATVTLADADA